jgi:hypothetical protein
MKISERLPRIFAASSILFAAVILAATLANAQTEPTPPLEVRLTFLKASYNIDDPAEKIIVTITLENTNGTPVWTQKGFSDLGYHQYLFFYGPLDNDPKLFTSTYGTNAPSPTPSVPPPKVAVEELGVGWLIYMPTEPDVRDYYSLTEPGQYKVWFSMPFVQYDPAQVEEVRDESGILIGHEAPPDAVLWNEALETQDAYITLTTNVAPLTSDIRFTATEWIYLSKATRQPLTDIEVRLYKNSDIEKEGISQIGHRTCGMIATNTSIPFKIAERTGDLGNEYLFKNIQQDDYVVIGYAHRVTDYKHMWSQCRASNSNWGKSEISGDLRLVTSSKGKKSPAQSTVVTGSQLLIIQPEYVEWAGSEELYPIFFESLENWDVSVSIMPPEGFVADNSILSTNVSSELKALQFTVTDVNGDWIPTKVKYRVKHKKKTIEIDNEIGVRLTRKLAEEKGVSEWGREQSQEDHEADQEDHETDQEEKQGGKSKGGRKK